ncbi:hypothetical protein KDI_08080 [Dictyobacter arantiisoli]|uniref:Uncharacterized protein n=1 Tax=Dictyobacter arantiisoli TaxID=2014874 RepID=A0A5A5T8L5_9CHLR|nr:hypothetical protein KDI_08080 [Dictyobacter arantiisoli]
MIPQSGTISAIALEQQMDHIISDGSIPHANQPTRAIQKQPSHLRPLAQLNLDPATNTERHLQFLRFLVQRGTFNDDLKK